MLKKLKHLIFSLYDQLCDLFDPGRRAGMLLAQEQAPPTLAIASGVGPAEPATPEQNCDLRETSVPDEVLCLIFNKSLTQVVLVKIPETCPHPELRGKLNFPGGRVEPGEHPRDAAAREVAKETGLAVNLYLNRLKICPTKSGDSKLHVYYAVLDQRTHAARRISRGEQGARWLPLRGLRFDDRVPPDAVNLAYTAIENGWGSVQARRSLWLSR